MAEKKTIKTDEKLVDLLIPIGENDQEDSVWISINGKGYNIPKGKTVQVPEAVKWHWEMIQKQKAELRRKQQEAQKEGLSPMNMDMDMVSGGALFG